MDTRTTILIQAFKERLRERERERERTTQGG